MNYSLYKQAAKLIKLTGDYDDLADGIEVVPENIQVGNTSTVSGDIFNNKPVESTFQLNDNVTLPEIPGGYNAALPGQLSEAVHNDIEVNPIKYNHIPPNRGFWPTAVKTFTVGMNGLIANDALNRIGTVGHDFTVLPHPPKAGALGEYFNASPLARGISSVMSPVSGAFSVLEGLHGWHNAKEVFNPANTSESRAAYGMQAALNGTNMIGLSGHAAQPWMLKYAPGLLDSKFMRFVRGAGEMVPIAFAGDAALTAGQTLADMTRYGTLALQQKHEHDNATDQAWLDFLNEAKESESGREQIPTSFADTLDMIRRSNNPELDTNPEIGGAFGIGDSYINPRLKFIGDMLSMGNQGEFINPKKELELGRELYDDMKNISPEADRKRTEKHTQDYLNRLNYITGDQSESARERRQGETFDTTYNGNAIEGNGGMIYDSAARDMIKKEDPYITRFGWWGNALNAAKDYIHTKLDEARSNRELIKAIRDPNVQ